MEVEEGEKALGLDTVTPLSSKTKISQYLKTSNYSHSIYDEHKGSHPNNLHLY